MVTPSIPCPPQLFEGDIVTSLRQAASASERVTRKAGQQRRRTHKREGMGGWQEQRQRQPQRLKHVRCRIADVMNPETLRVARAMVWDTALRRQPNTATATRRRITAVHHQTPPPVNSLIGPVQAALYREPALLFDCTAVVLIVQKLLEPQSSIIIINRIRFELD